MIKSRLEERSGQEEREVGQWPARFCVGK